MRPGWLVLALLAPGPLAAQGIRLDGGLGVTSGTYLFEERTTTWSLSAGLAAELGAFTLRASVPVYLQNSTLVAGSATGHIPTGGSSSGTVADSGRSRQGGSRGGEGMGGGSLMALSHGGVEVPASAAGDYQTALGDPILSLSWRTRGRGTNVGLGATVKVPVADTATFGTGEWDVGASAGLSRAMGGGFLLAADVAYWRMGDLETLELRDPVYGSASLGYLSPSGWGGTLVASGGTTMVEGFDGPLSVGAGVHRISGGGSWSVLSTVGLSETSPDFSVGFLWSVRLSR
jgi:hypothetical protein